MPRALRGLIRSRPFALVLLADLIAAYPPLLLAHPGLVPADTKQYLYVSPLNLLKSAVYVFSPTESLGTITHQNVGYLFPMAPFYVALHAVGLPAWVAQRLWLGSCLFSAGAGVAYMGRTMSLPPPAWLVASLAYELSPYVLQYAEHLSALLIPYSFLGFVIALTIRSARDGSAPAVAVLAVLVAAGGSINATALVYLAPAPALWLALAVARREVSARAAVATASAAALLITLSSLWWLAGLFIEGKYGVNLLKYTETVEAVSSTSSPLEVLRGLGYWYFYVSDSYGPVITASPPYQDHPLLVALSLALPSIGLASAAAIRFKERTFFVLTFAVGFILSMGTYPYDHPHPFGAALKRLLLSGEFGEAFRSYDRALPMCVLAVSAFLGVLAGRIWEARPSAGALATSGLLAAVVANQPALFTGAYVSTHLARGPLPSYLYRLATFLDRAPSGWRAVVEPGQDFGSYTYGFTNDPPLMGTTSYPLYERMQVPYGTPPSIDYGAALDRPFQLNDLDPSSLAPLLSLASAKYLIIENDMAYARYQQPPPQWLARLLSGPIPGLKEVASFGPPVVNKPPRFLPYLTEQTLSLPAHYPFPPAFEIYSVEAPRRIVRAEPASGFVLVDGSADGLAAAAPLGLLGTKAPIMYVPTYLELPASLRSRLGPPSLVMITDTNQKQGRRWSSLRDDLGQVETASADPAKLDPNYAPLVVLPGGASSQTVAYYMGVKSIEASSYGSVLSYTPENRPYSAFDGNLDTAWLAGGFGKAVGQWISVKLARPVTTSYVTVFQAHLLLADRVISRVEVTLDGRRSFSFELGQPSLTKHGQPLFFGRKETFSALRITVTGVRVIGKHPPVSPVGFSEIAVPDLSTDGAQALEVLRVPQDLTDHPSLLARAQRVVYLFSRIRTGPYPPRSSPEERLVRTFSTPIPLTVHLFGLAHISATIPDELVDVSAGRVPAGPQAATQLVTRSSGRLPGDLMAEASSAFDGDPSTSWEPGLGKSAQVGAYVEADSPAPFSISRLSVTFVTDGRHSVPTRLAISTETGERTVSLPDLPTTTASGLTTATLSFPPLSGRQLRITVLSIHQVSTPDYYSHLPVALPVAIAEVSGPPGLKAPPLPARLPSTCRGDIAALVGPDGRTTPLWLQLVGSAAAAREGAEIRFMGCGPDAAGIRLPPGTYTLVTSLPKDVGIQVDEVALDTYSRTAWPSLPAPEVRVLSSSPTSYKVRVTNQASQPFFGFLVLGESFDKGFTASGPGLSSAHPLLLDGFANAWPISLGPSASTTITINFLPQRLENLGCLVSFPTIAGCLAFALVRNLRRRGRPRNLPARSPTKTSASKTVESSVLRSAARLAVAVLASLLVGWAVAGGVGLAAAVAGLVLGCLAIPAFLRGILVLAPFAWTTAATVASQAHHRFAYGSSWPSHFSSSNQLVLLGVTALVATCLADAAMRPAGKGSPQRRAEGRDGAPSEAGPDILLGRARIGKN